MLKTNKCCFSENNASGLETNLDIVKLLLYTRYEMIASTHLVQLPVMFLVNNYTEMQLISGSSSTEFM